MLALRGLMANYNDAVKSLTQMLSRFDPIGIGEGSGGVPTDEYEHEAREIVRRLIGRKDMGRAEVSTTVRDVFIEYFGSIDAGAARDYDPIADEIVAILRGVD